MQPHALRLEVGADHLATLTFDLPERKANIFTRGVVGEFEALLSELEARDDIACLVLLSGKPGIFVAGADIDEIARVREPSEAAEGSRLGHRLFGRWEALPFPTVAAIQGTCLGGGTELALASTYIVLSDQEALRIGLPEIRLGILPGWGGCVRLPRRVGLMAALDLILAGTAVTSRRALEIGLADAVLPDAGFLGHVRSFVESRPGKPRRRRPRSRWRAWLLEGNPIGRRFVFDQARRRAIAQTKGRYPAPLAALEVIRVGLEKGRKPGFDAEATAIGELATSATAKHLIHLFRLIEASKRDADDTVPREIARPAVVGAGVMGGGIAHLIADQARLPVRLRDVRVEPLATAMAHAARLFDRKVRRRRMTAAEKGRRMALIQPTTQPSGLGGADFVIEAVVENLEVKQQVFANLERLLAPDAILATNTSSLSVDAIGSSLTHRDRFVGMHFFNPVDRMPLVEVIAGKETGAATAHLAMAFARRLGKTPVAVRDGPGFLVNRLLAFYSAEAMWLLDEGHGVDQIDGAMLAWGMPMGPLRLADEVGLDVSAEVGGILAAAFPDRLHFPAWVAQVAADATRLGVKSGLGIYRYSGGHERGVDPAIYARLGLRPGATAATFDEIAERLLLPMVNEAARCLEEGVVEGPGALDLAMVFGIGFPPFRGGLCRWADERGLPGLTASLERLAERLGSRLAPSEALRRFAAAGSFY